MNACLWRKKENEDNIIEPESKKKKNEMKKKKKKKKKNYMRSEADGIYIIISFSRDSFCRIKLQLISHFPEKKIFMK